MNLDGTAIAPYTSAAPGQKRFQAKWVSGSRRESASEQEALKRSCLDRNKIAPEHDPEKCLAVFRKDHAQTKSMTIWTPAAPFGGLASSGDGRGFSTMSRRCELTAKGPQVGHKVSHSNIKTKRRFLPNLCNVTFISDALGRNVRLRVSTNAIKSVDHNGGLDTFLLKARAADLSPRALDLKRQIEKKVGNEPAKKAS